MELIDKEEVMKLQTYLLAEGEHEKLVMLNDVMAIQTVDVESVRHGEWLEPERDGSYTYDKRAYAKCSVCGCVEFLGYRHKYCPNCGAKMEEDDE